MKFAIIENSGSQIKVVEEQEILVNQIAEKKAGMIVFDKILLYSDDKTLVIGKPYVDQCQIDASYLGEIKGKKIKTLTYKAKARYRRRKGYRSIYKKVKIEKIKYGKD